MPAYQLGYTTALRTSWYWALIVGLYSSLTLFKGRLFPDHVPNVTVTLELAAGFTMGVLMVFRANRAYERWWEARTLWGTLVNVSRNHAIKVQQLVQPQQPDRERIRVLLDDLGIYTIPISVLVAYVAFGVEGIASYVEEPFGQSEDHLDLEAICGKIEETVNEIMRCEPV